MNGKSAIALFSQQVGDRASAYQNLNQILVTKKTEPAKRLSPQAIENMGHIYWS